MSLAYNTCNSPAYNKRWSGESQPESNRHAMREGLLEAMGDGVTVRFGTTVVGMDVGREHSAVLRGRGGETLGTYDVVIDASGVSSPLRPLRVAAEEGGIAQHYNGLTMVNGILDEPEKMLDPTLVRMLGEGTVEIVGDRADGAGGFMMMIQRYGHRPADRRAKLQTFHLRSRRRELAEEVALGDIPYSHISRIEHPMAHARLVALLQGLSLIHI